MIKQIKNMFLEPTFEERVAKFLSLKTVTLKLAKSCLNFLRLQNNTASTLNLLPVGYSYITQKG